MSERGYDEESEVVRERRRRAMLTLGAVLLALFFAFWYAYSYYKAHDPANKPPAPCVAANAIAPATTTVNVLNSSGKDKLARTTANELDRRGYVIGTVGNDPKGNVVKGAAEVRYGPSGSGRAILVAKLVKGAVLAKDTRDDDTVDLVLGKKFAALVTVSPSQTPLPICRSSS